jgi:putative oxidoreductase
VRPAAALDRLAGRVTPYAVVFLRIAVGWVFLRHGLVKLGMGVGNVSGFFHGLGIPLPHVFAVVVMSVETVGAACVLAGALTRFWAALMAVDMIVAITVAILPTGRAFELEGLLLAGALALVGLGDGPLSVGRLVRKGARSGG